MAPRSSLAMQAGLTQAEQAAEPPHGNADAATQGERRGFSAMMVNTLGQRIAPLEAMREALGKRLDDTDLQRQPSIGDAIGERPRSVEQRATASGQVSDHRAQRRRSLSIGERFDRQ